MWETLIIEPMINTLLFIYSILGSNFGLAIIVFTILVRLLTHPFTVQQIKSSTAMQDMQKSEKYQAIQKKYKNDREKLAQAQMELYKEMGVSPFGACLPTLLQFPIIIGLYQSIIRALAASPVQLLDLSSHIYDFFPNVINLIPLNSTFLWMDLSKPEGIPVAFLENVPLLSNGIPVLAIIVVATTFLQSKLMTPAAPANPGDQSAMMGNMMSIYMPLLMGWLALTFASGLALYFVASNLFTIGQYAALGRLDLKNLLPNRAASS